MSASDIESTFPKVASDGYKITSPMTSDYNCIAWAGNDTEDWWWPPPSPNMKLAGYYWPDGVPKNRSKDSFILLYKLEGGFLPCDNGELEDGFEKIAIYSDSNGDVTHAARQLPSGAWTSKLGNWEDIEHKTIHGIEGPSYGRVIQYMKRNTTKTNEEQAKKSQ